MTPPASGAAERQDAELDRKKVVAATRAVILVGNPNVGKSVLFGALTGKYVTVSNYPGTTVEVTRGAATIEGQPWHVMDTPGTNNLLPMSEDEQVTRDILFTERGYACLQVCDAKNLRRGLLLSAQLAEAEVPFVLALNMADEAESRGITIDEEALARTLQVDVVRTVAVQRKGLSAIQSSLGAARSSPWRPRYDDAIEAAVAEVSALLPRGGMGPRALAIMALYKQAHPDAPYDVPVGSFVRLLNSIDWTDRNKASFVLVALTESRDPALLKQVWMNLLSNAVKYTSRRAAAP